MLSVALVGQFEESSRGLVVEQIGRGQRRDPEEVRQFVLPSRVPRISGQPDRPLRIFHDESQCVLWHDVGALRFYLLPNKPLCPQLGMPFNDLPQRLA